MRFDILRRARGGEAYWQSFDYGQREDGETVATALTKLNGQAPLVDITGKEAPPIEWQRSCLQKKCGACAMVICGRPMLACDAKLSELGEVIRLEPLRKFPVVADLMVDRSAMFENLEAIRLWLTDAAKHMQRSQEIAYEASRCLQCGCCLEVCPNFYAGGKFFGTASAVPMARLLAELPDSQKKELSALYREHVYSGCGKSLACRNICPAGIDVDRVLASSGAVAVWKRFYDKKEKSVDL